MSMRQITADEKIKAIQDVVASVAFVKEEVKQGLEFTAFYYHEALRDIYLILKKNFESINDL